VFTRISLAERTSKKLFKALSLRNGSKEFANGHFILQISFRLPLGKLT
jgi:hypothetical protein